MIRRCPWCRMKYETGTESSIWCPKNPHRGKGEKRIKPKVVRIGCLVLPTQGKGRLHAD
jgi:hypothetical protein